MRKTLNNYRVLGSVVYMILTRLDPILDKVVALAPTHSKTLLRRFSPLFDVENQMLLANVSLKKSAPIHPMPVSTDITSDQTKAKRRTSIELYNPLMMQDPTASKYVDIEEILMNPRPTFEPLERIQSMLLPEQYFANIIEQMEPWIEELRDKLDDWITKLTIATVELKLTSNEHVINHQRSVSMLQSELTAKTPH